MNNKEQLQNLKKIPELQSQLDESAKNTKIYNGREIKYVNLENYGFDLANLVGQGLYPKNSLENNKFRAMVIHNYVDTEVLTLDNVGEMPTLFIRNARNVERRIDKPSNFIPTPNYLQFQQGFMLTDEQGNEIDKHYFETMFNMDYQGNLQWRNNRDDVDSVKFQSISLNRSKNKFAFMIGSYYNTRYVADFQYENNKSALKICMDTSGNTQLMTATSGLKFSAYKNNVMLESIEGSVVLKESTGSYIYKNGINLPISRFVATKPTSATAEGNKGDYYCDSLNLYVCYNPNLWAKFNISNW